MTQIIFKNLEKSELAKEIALERFQTVLDRFPDLERGKVRLTLSMDNSPQQAGPDLFGVKVHCMGGRYRDVVIEKHASNLYLALADVVDHLLERLNRYGDKKRVKQRNQERNFQPIFQEEGELYAKDSA